MASMANTPAASAAVTMLRACAAVVASGFSTSTCLPAAMASSASRACSLCGAAT
jgi:hypothetical protein